NDHMEFSKNLSPYVGFSTGTLYVRLLQSFTLSQFKKYNITKRMIEEGKFNIDSFDKNNLDHYQYLAILDSGYGDMFD
ncbi:hypothetical protein KY334_05900, partial [Candidatus Woesearchaeota archaeon]|nr:hypothetical protein [Candidatus Woesearchaeota archaeon]